MTGKTPEAANDSNPQPRKPSTAAQRARAEADERRKPLAQPDMPPEVGGRGGADPARFGDWEVNGRAIDF